MLRGLHVRCIIGFARLCIVRARELEACDAAMMDLPLYERC